MKLKDYSEQDYKKIIEDNKNTLNDSDNLENFINSYLYGDNELTDLEDYISEYADGLVPIYYNDIVKEWHENGDAREMALEIQGEYTGDDIYKMMQSDLFYYYDQQLREDYTAFLELLEDLKA